ncbi:MAG: YwiC-like family protein [Ardenticatenaceae bacterium]|nr:YwiC-like family protein [Ardenticatenaceae bacterium]MCB9446385.1 YwiC-like family protein [Ardenticatenaceae bacterium]
MDALNKNSQNGRRIALVYRKHIVMPAEHGSWSWLLVPFFVGTAVAKTFNLPVLLALLGGLAVFFLRQPATVWLRVRRKKARASDGPIALAWMGLFTAVGLVCLIGLLLLGRSMLAWLMGPFLLIFGLYMAAARYGRSGLRSLWMELAGAAALSMTAPAAAIAAAGQIESWMWTLWGIMAVQNVLGALYVRLRVYDTHNQAMKRWPIAAAHLAGLFFVLGLGVANFVPVVTAVPFAGFFLRSLWTVGRQRPVANIKKFGFIELGVEIISGLWLAASCWIA